MNKDNPMANDRSEFWEQSFYRTGSTRPPKSHRGLLAAMLITIIFLCGVFTAFSLLNVRFFQSMPTDINAPKASDGIRGDGIECIGFAVPNAPVKERANPFFAQDHVSCLGVSVKQLSSFEQLYYRLPSGLYITKVDPATDAAAKGLAPGDILLSIDGTTLADTDTLQQLLSGHSAGEAVSVAIYRNSQQRRMKLTLTEIE